MDQNKYSHILNLNIIERIFLQYSQLPKKVLLNWLLATEIG